MVAIVPMLDRLLVYKVLAIHFILTLFSCQCHENGNKRLTPQKLDSIFEKYMTAIKRLSADFPNHQIELHLDIAGENLQKPRRRVNYIHLREPAHPNARSNGKNKTEEIMVPKPLSYSSDPDMQPVLMKDFKKAIGDLERKYNGQQIDINAQDTPQKSDVDVNMKPILQLLEKGKLVKSEIPQPSEDNMSWLQIRIPK